MLRRGLPAVIAGLALLTTTLAGPSYAGTNAIVDNSDYDVPHRDIHVIPRAKVAEGGKARSQRRLRMGQRVQRACAHQRSVVARAVPGPIGNHVHVGVDESR